MIALSATLAVLAFNPAPPSPIVFIDVQGSASTLEKAEAVALRHAAEQALAENPRAGSAVAHSLVAEDRLYASAADFVRPFEVLESRMKHGVMLVTVRAAVDALYVEKRIAEIRALMDLLGRHRVMVAVAEHVQGTATDARPTRVFTAAMGDALRRDGWEVLDGAGRLSDGDAPPEEITKVARELGAQLLLRGDVTFKRQAPNSNSIIPEKSSTGEQLVFFSGGAYTLEMVELGSSTVSVRFDGTLSSDRPGMRSYANAEVELCKRSAPGVASKLRDQVVDSLRTMKDRGDAIRVSLTNATYAQVTAFEQSLKKVAGVRSVDERGGYENQAQVLEVTFAGSAQKLAAQLIKLTPKPDISHVSVGVIEAGFPAAP
jgi:hypothetical protein